MIFELFLLGTLPFWILSAVFLIGLLWAIDNDNGGASTVFTIGFIVLLYFFGDLSLRWIWQNAGSVIVYLGLYLLAGVFWALGNWWFHVSNIRRKYEAFRADFLKAAGRPADSEIEPNRRGDFDRGLRDFERQHGSVPPQSSQNKAKITMWMAYWPASLVWTFINDPVRRAIEYLYQILGNSFQKISDSIFGKHAKDFTDRR